MISTREVPLAFDEAAPSYDRWSPATRATTPTSARPRRAAGGGPGGGGAAGGGSGLRLRGVHPGAAGGGGPERLRGRRHRRGRLLRDARSARTKTWPARVTFVHGLAEDLAARRAGWGLAGPVHAVFAAYLFRNLDEPGPVLA